MAAAQPLQPAAAGPLPDSPGAKDAALRDAAGGDPAAADRLFAMLYADLRQLARSRLRQSGDITLLDTTALVHESYLRLRNAAPPDFPDQHHFLAYAAKAMRSVVVDMVRSRQAERHGGGLARVTWRTDWAGAEQRQGEEVLRVNQALEDLARMEPRLATVVELRYFGGLSETEIAAMLGLTLRTVQRDWTKARLYLSLALQV
jgi:RNA polymerase sigma factor (TIGR02999 family)